ncbi:hypothetical protein AZSI13_29390 [Azospira sp. I13]|uniref:hypothetical protein n=1 Tax=Azospira sp. I13 TaxID=1765050 RepID=UPI000D40E4C8|nr:hypothetical protein [Azospira sp. I13]GBG03612.1 hypothetical protein AZSI13_29390 [Azospira sp. I13]
MISNVQDKGAALPVAGKLRIGAITRGCGFRAGQSRERECEHDVWERQAPL